MKLLGLAAKARCGKDTVADYLVENFNFRKYAFADPLKEAASKMFGVPIWWFYNAEKKEQVIEEWGYSPRQMAQLLGTEGGRKLFREDIWLKRAEVELNLNTNIDWDGMVITDLRFENEADFIRSHGGIVIHILREGAPEVSDHESEKGILVREKDIVIENDGTIHDLYRKVICLMGNSVL
jgi:hypothetical protein